MLSCISDAPFLLKFVYLCHNPRITVIGGLSYYLVGVAAHAPNILGFEKPHGYHGAHQGSFSPLLTWLPKDCSLIRGFTLASRLLAAALSFN